MLVGDLIKKAMEEIHKHELFDDFSKRDLLIMGVLREAAQTETQFQKTVDPLSDETSTEEVEQRVSPIISQHRIDLIKRPSI